MFTQIRIGHQNFRLITNNYHIGNINKIKMYKVYLVRPKHRNVLVRLQRLIIYIIIYYILLYIIIIYIYLYIY